MGSRAPRVAKSSGTVTTGYKTNGDLRGVSKNEQNVPTLAVIGVPVTLIALVSFLGKTWA